MCVELALKRRRSGLAVTRAIGVVDSVTTMVCKGSASWSLLCPRRSSLWAASETNHPRWHHFASFLPNHNESVRGIIYFALLQFRCVSHESEGKSPIKSDSNDIPRSQNSHLEHRPLRRTTHSFIGPNPTYRRTIFLPLDHPNSHRLDLFVALHWPCLRREECVC